MKLKLLELYPESGPNIRRKIKHAAAFAEDLDAAARELKNALPGFFVYRGGHHVSVHPESGNPLRLALIRAHNACAEGGAA